MDFRPAVYGRNLRRISCSSRNLDLSQHLHRIRRLHNSFKRNRMNRQVSSAIGVVVVIGLFLSLSGCMHYEPVERENINSNKATKGLFIMNEGNFRSGNASLSYYDPDSMKVENYVFYRTNGIKLGDVAQSMTIRDSLGYLVVNNSGIIFVINVIRSSSSARYRGLVSPPLHPLPERRKGLRDRSVLLLHLGHQSQRVQDHQANRRPGRREEPTLDRADGPVQELYFHELLVLRQQNTGHRYADRLGCGLHRSWHPTDLISIDKYNKIWTITDGGYEGSPYGYTAPALYRIDAETRKIEQTFNFKLGDSGSEICMNGTRDTLYFINKHIWRMAATSDKLPDKPSSKIRPPTIGMV